MTWGRRPSWGAFRGFLCGLVLFAMASCGGEKEKTLELWTPFTGADGNMFSGIVDAYNATNPEYKIVNRPMDAPVMYTRLQLAVGSGKGIPDIAVNHLDRIPLFAEQGRLMDMKPYLASSPIKSENYIPRAWEISSIGGGQYGVPLDVHSFILYVNWDLYEKYGLTDLDDGTLTWDELRATAAKVATDGIVPIGLGPLSLAFLTSYIQRGGPVTEDGVNPSMDNELAREVMAHYRALASDGITNLDGEDPWRMFLGGGVVYMWEGVWMINAIREAGLYTRSFDAPVFTPESKGNWTGSHTFTIPSRNDADPERVAASLAFINWFGEHSETWAMAGHVPAHRGGQTGVFLEMPQAFLADENDALVIVNFKNLSYVLEAFDKVVADIMFGKLDLEEGMRQAFREMADRIAAGG